MWFRFSENILMINNDDIMNNSKENKTLKLGLPETHTNKNKGKRNQRRNLVSSLHLCTGSDPAGGDPLRLVLRFAHRRQQLDA